MAIEQGVQSIEKHPQYYLRDGNVTFLAEGLLFRVHRHFFERESEFFFNYFTSSEEGDGTDKKPYVLKVKSDHFAKFLWVWYNPRYTYSNQPKDTWLVILTLATRWGFESMRELAVRQLERIALGPIDKIALYKEHKIDGRLLIPSYIELCKSPTLPSFNDGERLTMETVLRLAAARERALLRALERGVVTPTSADVEDSELESIVSDVFELGAPLSGGPEPFGRAPSTESTESWVEINGSNGNGAGSSCPTITIRAPQVPPAASNGAGAPSNGAKNKGKGKSK